MPRSDQIKDAQFPGTADTIHQTVSDPECDGCARSTSQSANPIVEAPRLHYHQFGLTRPVGQDRDSLQCREKMNSKSSRVVSMSICPKLILYPRKWLYEECRRFFSERPSFLMQLG